MSEITCTWPADFEYEELHGLDKDGKPLFFVSGWFKVWAYWEPDDREWQVEQVTARIYATPDGEWRRIDDEPGCEAIMRGIEALVAEEDAPEWADDPEIMNRRD